MRILLAFVFCFILSGVAHAQDEGLYAPKAPEGSAFVRFVNVDDVAVNMKANDKSYGDLVPLQSSSYYVLPKGDVSFNLGKKKTSETLIAGGYYTVTKKGLVKDTTNADRTKATLALYNLREGENTVSMKAKGGSVSVLENIAVGKSAARDINPVKIDPTVHIMVAGGSEYSKLAPITVEPFIMERGNHYSVFYNGTEAFVVTASTDTTR